MVQAFAVRKPWARAVLKPCARATAMLLILFSSSIVLALMPLCKALVALPLCKAIQALPLRKAMQVGPASRTSTCHPTLDPSNLFLKIQFWHLVPSTAPVHQKYWPHWGLDSCRPSKGSISISAIVQVLAGLPTIFPEVCRACKGQLAPQLAMAASLCTGASWMPASFPAASHSCPSGKPFLTCGFEFPAPLALFSEASWYCSCSELYPCSGLCPWPGLKEVKAEREFEPEQL